MHFLQKIASLPPRRMILLFIGCFFLIGLAVYGRSLTNQFVRWDDGMLIYENPAVREISPWSLHRIFTTYDPELYIPLTFISYQIDYKLSGTNPFAYHLTSLLIHIGNALLVAWLTYLLLGTVGIEGKKGIEEIEGKLTSLQSLYSLQSLLSLFAGLLFLLHPLHTEAVEWASGRKDVLSTVFFLASIIAYMRWRDVVRQAHHDKHLYIWSLAFFVLGLLSKVMIITLPAILLLTDYVQARPLSKRMITEKLPYAGIAVLFGIIAIFGKTAVVASSTLSQKILMACKSTAFYLEKIFVPVDFSLLYPYTKAITIASPDFYIPVIVVIVLLLTAFLVRNRYRMITAGILFYLLTLAPTFINFAKGGDLDIYFASDRYAYIPSIGIFLLVSAVLAEIVFDQWTRIRIMLAAGVMVLATLAFLSYQQSRVWRDTETLFTNVLTLYPESSHVAHNNLGNMYRLQGDVDRSIDEYKKAISIRPHPKTWSNLGAAYRKKGMMTEALVAYQSALKLDPKSAIAHIGYAVILVDQGNLAEAEKEYKTGIGIDPGEEVGATNLGVLYTQQGRLEDAIAMYHLAMKQNPYFADAHYNLAVTLQKKGDDGGAVSEYREVIHIAPSFIPARLNLALLLYKQGNVSAAVDQFKTILQIDPSNAAAKSALRQIGQ